MAKKNKTELKPIEPLAIDTEFAREISLREILSSEFNLVISVLVSISLAQFLTMIVNDISLSTSKWLFETILVTLITITLIVFLVYETRMENSSIFSSLLKYLTTIFVFLTPYSLQRHHNIPSSWGLSHVGWGGFVLGLSFICWGGYDIYLTCRKEKQKPQFQVDGIKIVVGIFIIIISLFGGNIIS